MQETTDAPPEPPGDTVDKEATFASVSAALFGKEAEAPRIGPYFVLERIGAGAMGVVYAAFDPELERKVAVKVLHPSRSGGEQADARLIREARALAKLSHPNVVTVFAAGASERGVWVAMEFVEGQNLAQWLEGSRSQEEILELFAKAGAGLSAAHAAGIVHRDFKPHNVLVGEDGSVHVADFGVARPTGVTVQGATPAMSGTGGTDDSNLTRTGGVVGTPAYMAPEQQLGEKVGPAADQYAFCVSLFEALHGVLPLFADEKDKRASVPAQVQRAIDRGLAVDPKERFESMDALLEALAPRASSMRTLGVVASIGVLGLAVALGGGPKAAAVEAPVCEGFESELAEVWNDDARASVRTAIEGTQVALAEEVAERSIEKLDAYASGWIETRADLCRATRVRGDQSEQLLDRRVACLDRQRGQLRRTIEVIGEAEASMVPRISSLLGGLGSLEECRTVDGLGNVAKRSDDPEVRARGDALLAELAELYPVFVAGRTDEIATTMDRIEAEYAGLDDPLPLSVMYKTRGWVTKDTKEKEKLDRAALASAIQANDPGAILASYADLVSVLDQQDRRAEAIDVGKLGVAAAEHALWLDDANPEPSRKLHRQVGHLHNTIAIAHIRDGALEKAEAEVSRAIEHIRIAGEDGVLNLPHALNTRAAIRTQNGRIAEAAEDFDASVRAMIVAYGPNDDMVASAISNRSIVRRLTGEYAASAEDLRKVLVMRKALGKEKERGFINTTYNLGLVEMERGNWDEALANIETAHGRWEEILAEDDLILAESEGYRGWLLACMGRAEEGRAWTEKGMARLAAFPRPKKGRPRVKTLHARLLIESGHSAESVALLREAFAEATELAGENGQWAVEARSTLAVALSLEGQTAEALEHFEAVIADYERQELTEHPRLGTTLIEAGLADLAHDNRARGLSRIEQGISLRQTEPGDPVHLAFARAALGKVRGRADAQARETLQNAGSRGELALARLEALDLQSR